MNKRFFAEFLALLSLKVNPDPDANDDAEIDIVKQIFAHNNDSPTAPEIPSKFPDDSSVDFYDEEESTGGSCTSSCKDSKQPHHEARNRHSGSVKKSKEGTDKKLSKKQKSIIAQAGLKTLKKAK